MEVFMAFGNLLAAVFELVFVILKTAFDHPLATAILWYACMVNNWWYMWGSSPRPDTDSRLIQVVGAWGASMFFAPVITPLIVILGKDDIERRYDGYFSVVGNGMAKVGDYRLRSTLIAVSMVGFAELVKVWLLPLFERLLRWAFPFFAF